MSTSCTFNPANRSITLLLIVICYLMVGACGKTAQGESTRAESQQVLTISTQGNQLAFDTSTLRAQGNSSIKLTLKNNSTNFEHNWVLVSGDTDIADQVYQAALAAGDNRDFLPDEMSTVLTHTEMVAAGQQETIVFTAPAAPGSYTFLCTFPGHYLAGMKGTLIVSAP